MPHASATPARKHRSPAQWAALLSRFERSGQSVSAFCAQESISVAHFYRQRGLHRGAVPDEAAGSDAPCFVDLGALRAGAGSQPVDMRKSFDGLQALVRQSLGCDPLSGQLFVFINRRATHMKVLYRDRSGFCVWMKRLEQGRFVSDWSRVLQRVGQHPAAEVAQLTPRLCKQHFADNPMRSDLDRVAGK